jgi:putative membrane protein
LKTAVRLLFALSLCATVWLIERGGLGSILDLMSKAGWLLVLLLPLHAVPVLFDVLGWRILIRGRNDVPMLFRIAWVREAINRLLPVANVGGEIVGVRLLAQQGPGLVPAAASVIVETLLTVVSQFIFVACGAACLLQVAAAVPLASRVLWGLVVLLPAVVLSLALLRDGRLFRWLVGLAEALLGQGLKASKALQAGASLDAAIRALLGSHGGCARAVGWQTLGLVAGCAETWMVLHWFGHPVGFPAALALESIAQAARHFIFVVPAGLGVQEAALIGVGHLLGLDMSVALALSLAKRTRELLFGLPGLAVWQWLESRRPSG